MPLLLSRLVVEQVPLGQRSIERTLLTMESPVEDVQVAPLDFLMYSVETTIAVHRRVDESVEKLKNDSAALFQNTACPPPFSGHHQSAPPSPSRMEEGAPAISSSVLGPSQLGIEEELIRMMDPKSDEDPPIARSYPRDDR